MKKQRVFVLLLLLLLRACVAAAAYQNVALRGKASQSTRFEHVFGDAHSAIDGNRDGTFNHGSCTHTAEQREPWWTVDLLDPYAITSITITNRQDCCPFRLSGVRIHIGNNNGLQNPVATSIASVGKEYTHNFTKPVEGRYVTLSLPGRTRILSLCEVEVFGYPAPTGENLAFQGKACQSSLHQFGAASNAIDGNSDSKWEHGSCSHTSNDISPWWRLDLGHTHKVVSVNVTNIDTNPERLDGAEIRIGDSLENNGNDNPRCAVIPKIQAGMSGGFLCGGMDGRYVNIVLPDREEFLTLCEVEVYGSRLD
ncbi:unnamed protein product [Tetraodon nigroviridis]|uniref:Chromosome undetermined SCAF8088, whole genome shotgun sequence n=1 Tax=Tetraodon nigroviridis TaxID=99883 RepID=Q4T7L0_TETNG|nr:unnamed protein product [Tetraodon nigroviridis]